MTARRTIVSASVATGLLAALAGCVEVTSDGELYSSVEELADAADVVVLGSIGGVRGTEIDDGGNEDGRGLEVTFHDLVVDSSWSMNGEPAPASGERLALGVSEGTLDLDEGAEVVLFLTRSTSDEAPGIDTEDVMYGVIGIDGNGALDVEDGAVIDRSGTVLAMTRADAEGREGTETTFTTSLGDLRVFLDEH